MEWFRNYMSLRYGVGLAMLFIVSLTRSCSELQHWMWGVESTATVIRVQESTVAKDGQYATLSFEDSEGRTQHVKRTIPASAGTLQQGQATRVSYLPGGADRARLVSERNLGGPMVLAVLVLSSLAWCFGAYRQVKSGRFRL